MNKEINFEVTDVDALSEFVKGLKSQMVLKYETQINEYLKQLPIKEACWGIELDGSLTLHVTFKDDYVLEYNHDIYRSDTVKWTFTKDGYDVKGECKLPALWYFVIEMYKKI